MFSFGFLALLLLLTAPPVTEISLNSISLIQPIHLTHASPNKLHTSASQVLKLAIQGNPDNLSKGQELLLQATIPSVMPLTDSLYTLSIKQW